jgi:hypothetical protein
VREVGDDGLGRSGGSRKPMHNQESSGGLQSLCVPQQTASCSSGQETEFASSARVVVGVAKDIAFLAPK